MGLKIQIPGVGERLQRLFRLQGRVRPELEEFILPVVTVGDVSRAAEPPVRRRASVAFALSAVAGERPTLRLRAPADAILVLTGMHLWPGAAAGIDMGWQVGAEANNLLGHYMDTRLRALPGQSAQLPVAGLFGGTSAVAVTPVSWRGYAQANIDTFYEFDNVVVGPSAQGAAVGAQSTLTIQLTTNAQTLNGSLQWDEYPLV